VSVLLPESFLEGLDELVRVGMYPSRSAAVRVSVRDLLKKELWQFKRHVGIERQVGIEKIVR